MRSRPIELIFLLIVTLTCAWTHAQPVDDSVFWQATRGEKMIHLLGASHIGYEEHYPIGSNVLTAFNTSSTYVLESSVLFDPAPRTKEMIVKMYDPRKGGSLRELISNHQCQRLRRDAMFAQELTTVLGDDSDLVTGLMKASPRAAVHLVYSWPTLSKNAAAADPGSAVSVEHHLLRRAIILSMKLDSLDPEFWESMDELSTEQMCDLIRGLVDLHLYLAHRPPDSPNEFTAATLSKLWIAGQSREIEKEQFRFADQFFPSYAKVHREWFARRNQKMSEKIEALSSASSAPIFVAVGASHLAGTNGVVAILRRMGYDVKPMPR